MSIQISKNRDFLLENLENYNFAYQIDINELTVEHIMPQTLNEDWKKSLEEKYKNCLSKIFLF